MAREAEPTASPARGCVDPLARAAEHLHKGRIALVLDDLLPVLDQRAAEGDRVCALAAAALRLAAPEACVPRPPDALAGALDRLLALVRQQQDQIRTLRDLIKDAM